MPTLPNIPAILIVAAGGALIAYVTYRVSTRRKVEDLRTELRAEQELLRAAIETLPAQIESAKRSRTAAARAAGAGLEGLQQWFRELELDLSEVELLSSQVPAADSDYESSSDLDVDIKLVEVLALSLRVNALVEKYRASISIQETDREPLTDDAEALLLEASQFSLHNSRSSIRESVV